jgi:transposase-like protein
MSRPRRLFPADLKAQVVLQLLTGAATQAELCRKYNLKPQLLTHWKDAVIERMHSLFDQTDEAALLRVRIGELEQLLGRQALEIEILKKASRMLPGLLKRDGSLS